jgi:predicted dithiol-disulfide oxidoreductase (DUF899 family)
MPLFFTFFLFELCFTINLQIMNPNESTGFRKQAPYGGIAGDRGPYWIATPEEWMEARMKLLLKERELGRLRTEVNRQRMAMPWEMVDSHYVFDGPNGKETLADLFDGRSQLIIQHFMFGPEWEEGCVGCSFTSDHIDGALVHLEHHDVSLVVVSRAPFPKLDAFKKRMGWRFKWVSAFNNDFNYDYHVSFRKGEIDTGKVFYNYGLTDFQSEEMSGHNVFYKDDAGNVFHTYSSYGNADDVLIGTYNYLDFTPKGRNENGPSGNLTDWVRHHDRYDDAHKIPGSCCNEREGGDS